MKKYLGILLIATICTTMFYSCKKEESGETLFVKNGSVTGTINGLTQSGVGLNDEYAFDSYMEYSQKQTYEITNGGDYEFDIQFSREDGSEFRLTFYLNGQTDNKPKDVGMSIANYITKGNQLIYFSMQSNNNTYTLSDFSFNAESGRTQGKIITSGDVNSTNINATVVANFDVTLKQLVQ